MSLANTTIAVIIARKGSKRIPHKMHKPFSGDTLLTHKIKQCVAIPSIQQVVVGSDDESIRDTVMDLGAKFILREDKYCDEKSTTVNDVVRNMLSFFNCENVLWSHPTNPFIDTPDYMDALQALESAQHIGYDSLFSVNKLNGHFWTTLSSPINFAPLDPIHKIASHIPPVYQQNGGIFIRPYKDMLKDGAFIAGNAFMYITDPLTGWDIDYPWQLEFAQWYAENKWRKASG